MCLENSSHNTKLTDTNSSKQTDSLILKQYILCTLSGPEALDTFPSGGVVDNGGWLAFSSFDFESVGVVTLCNSSLTSSVFKSLGVASLFCSSFCFIFFSILSTVSLTWPSLTLFLSSVLTLSLSLFASSSIGGKTPGGLPPFFTSEVFLVWLPFSEFCLTSFEGCLFNSVPGGIEAVFSLCSLICS